MPVPVRAGTTTTSRCTLLAHPGSILIMLTTKEILNAHEAEQLEQKLNEFFETQNTYQTIDDIDTVLRACGDVNTLLHESTLEDIRFRFTQIMKLVAHLQQVHQSMQYTRRVAERAPVAA